MSLAAAHEMVAAFSELNGILILKEEKRTSLKLGEKDVTFTPPAFGMSLVKHSDYRASLQ